jgi:hypothetical protein
VESLDPGSASLQAGGLSFFLQSPAQVENADQCGHEADEKKNELLHEMFPLWGVLFHGSIYDEDFLFILKS